MGQAATMTVKRHKVEIFTDVAVTIDSINLDMQTYDGGAAPYDAFTIYSQWNNLDIQRGDSMIDQATGTIYLVVSKPEQYFNGATEIKAVVMIGT
jgi:hypothetical protein